MLGIELLVKLLDTKKLGFFDMERPLWHRDDNNTR
jgi:hypothetical protein